MCSDPNDEVRQMATQLVSDRHQLSKIYTQNTKIVTEFDRLSFLIPLAINTWKNAIIGIQIKELQARIKRGGITHDESQSLLKQLQELFRVRRELARRIGDRVVNPK